MSDEDRIRQGKALRELVELLKFKTQEEFADSIGWNKFGFSRAIAGIEGIPKKFWLRIARDYVEPLAKSREEFEEWICRIGASLSQEECDAIWLKDAIDPPDEAPWLPVWYVRRHDLLEQLKHRALALDEQSNIILIVGMPGSGKSTQAAALLREEIIRKRFSAGIYWFRWSKEPRHMLRSLADRLGVDWSLYGLDWEGLRIKLALEMPKERSLLVIDDAESSASIDTLSKTLRAPSKIVVTTQYVTLADKLRVPAENIVRVEEMTLDESLELIRRKLIDANLPFDPKKATQLTELTGRLAIALEIAVCLIADQFGWEYVLNKLESERRLHVLQFDDPEGKLDSVELCFNISYDALTAEARSCLHAFGVFRPGTLLSAKTLTWILPLSLNAAAQALGVLAGRSLVQIRDRFFGEPLYAAHTLIQAYAAKKAEDAEELEGLVRAHYLSAFQLVRSAREARHELRRHAIPTFYHEFSEHWPEILAAQSRAINTKTEEGYWVAARLAIDLAFEFPGGARPVEYQQLIECGIRGAENLGDKDDIMFDIMLKVHLAEHLAGQKKTRECRQLLESIEEV